MLSFQNFPTTSYFVHLAPTRCTNRTLSPAVLPSISLSGQLGDIYVFLYGVAFLLQAFIIFVVIVDIGMHFNQMLHLSEMLHLSDLF